MLLWSYRIPILVDEVADCQPAQGGGSQNS
jgi:hypothetical protein